jgi:ribonuclease III
MNATEEALASLADDLGHRFSDPYLLRQAVTHASASPRDQRSANERLEFLGDRVLAIVVAELLYRRFADEEEGGLARRFAVLVSRESLAQVALTLDLGRHLVMARGEEDSGGRANPAILADACEAVIAALYLDGGLEPARRFVERAWAPLIELDRRPPQDAKTTLQEWAQAAGRKLPSYVVVATSGPPHDPLFTVEARVDGIEPAAATGRSKRVAEQAAAAALLRRLKQEGRP